MTTSTDRARGLLERAAEWELDWHKDFFDLLALAIKQHEALRGEHLGGLSAHAQVVAERGYAEMSLTCPECLVLLQWEQMWKEEKTG